MQGLLVIQKTNKGPALLIKMSGTKVKENKSKTDKFGSPKIWIRFISSSYDNKIKFRKIQES